MARATDVYENLTCAKLEEERSMTNLVRILAAYVAWVILSCAWYSDGRAAERSTEQLYATLAKLLADQRETRIEEGARKEGKLNFVHTWRGKNARDHVKLFEKRYPFVKVDMGDLGSQDAAERFIAEESAGRHLTDILTLGVPGMAIILKHNFVAKFPTPASKQILKQCGRTFRFNS